MLSLQPARRATISIHALREEGDRCTASRRILRNYFYPRPPRGGRHRGTQTTGKDAQFLSTPSARRATANVWIMRAPFFISTHALREEGDQAGCFRDCPSIYFYPRPPRGGRLLLASLGFAADTDFYPRPPRGGRLFFGRRLAEHSAFLSTPSARRATAKGLSFHRTGAHFYPRPPRGGRLSSM